MTALSANPHACVVWWSDLARWVNPDKTLSFPRLPKGWTLARIGDVVQQLVQREKVTPDGEYRMIGVKWYGEGTFHRETVSGNSTRAKHLYHVVPGALIYNRLFAWKVSFAVVPQEQEGCFVSGEFPQLWVDESRLLPEYLYLYCITGRFIRAVNAASVGSAAVSRNRFKEEEFLDFPVPLPPLPVQRAIVGRWQEAQDEIAKAQVRADDLEAAVSREILKRLGIQLAKAESLPKVFAVYWKDLERWDVEFNRYPMRAEKLLVSSKFAAIPLEQVAWVNPTARKSAIGPNDPVSFVPMEAVSEESGEIVQHLEKPCREVAKGYTRFENEDVIWAKITPCMQNGKCAIGKNLVNGVGFGSTEFHVVRTKDARKLLPEFVWALLRLEAVRQCAQRYFIGAAGQQRVPPSFLLDLSIPLPPLDVQRKIIDMVAQSRAEVAHEREAAAKLSAEVTQEVEEMIMGMRPVTRAT